MLALMLLTALSVGQATAVEASSPLVVPEAGVSTPLGRHLALFVDDSGRMTAEEAERLGAFVPSTRAEPGWGFKRRVVWARFRTPPTAAPGDWVLHADFPRPHRIDLYERGADGRWRRRGTGGLFETQNEGFQSHDILLPVDLSRQEHLLRIDVQPARLNLFLVERHQRLEDRGFELLLAGIYFGIFLGLFLYNFFLGLSLRDGTHAFYCLFLLAIAMHVSTRDGIGFTDLPEALFGRGGGLTLTSLILLVFARRFLRLKHRIPELPRLKLVDRVFSALMIASVLLSVAATLTAATAAVASVVAAVSIVVVVVAAVMVARRGDRPAAWFLLAWSVLIASCLGLVLLAFGLVDPSPFTTYGLKIGSALEMILLSLALASRVRALRSEKEHAQRTLAVARANARAELAGRVLQTQEDERSRFARELHDGLGHALLLLKQRLLQAARGTTPMTPEEAGKLGADAQECINEARAMARNMVPTSLSRLGLLEALRATCQDVARGGSFAVTFECERAADLEQVVFDDRAVHILRIVQEALANAIRHGHARHVTVEVLVDDAEGQAPWVAVSIQDDGLGFDPARVPPGRLGLVDMEQRARIVGGSLEVTSGQGTRIVVRVPLDALVAPGLMAADTAPAA